MKQRLEDFIRQNRDAFDDKKPDEKVWRGVASALPATRKPVWNNVSMWRAAAILFMALSVYLVLPDHVRVIGSDMETLNEFRDVEAFYFQQISDKVRLIDTYERSEGLNGFTQDIHQLEAMYMVLKEEMEARPSRKVKDALVLNLLVRIDLLNQQLQKLDQHADEDDETPAVKNS
ncbi:MAG TPA: hypothetical protein VIH22_11695 [Cyclobacteriaceae bacterium]|jgi:hypothetical protein